MLLLLAKWATPAIAQLVEHLTVECCSNQMVPGSIPGGRIFLTFSAPRQFEDIAAPVSLVAFGVLTLATLELFIARWHSEPIAKYGPRTSNCMMQHQYLGRQITRFVAYGGGFYANWELIQYAPSLYRFWLV